MKQTALTNILNIHVLKPNIMSRVYIYDDYSILYGGRKQSMTRTAYIDTLYKVRNYLDTW